MTDDYHDLETMLYTAMSVALSALESMMGQVQPEHGGPQLGYMKGIAAEARHELELFLEDRDSARIETVQRLVSEANAYLSSST